jgi:hypothetical protein
VEQKREPMDKNRIGGIRRRASKQRIAKPISIKVAGCRSGGCARKAVELTSGDLRCVGDFRLKTPQGVLTASQKSAEGIVVLKTKARTVIESSSFVALKEANAPAFRFGGACRGKIG